MTEEKKPARRKVHIDQHLTVPHATLRHLQPATLIGPGVADETLVKAFRPPVATLVSFPRAGRTWLRVMLAHAFERQFAVQSAKPLDTEAIARAEPRIPRVIITSGRSDPRRLTPDKLPRNLDWAGRRTVVLLARDPRDIAVSLYFDRTRRARFYREAMPYKGTIGEFLREKAGSLRTIVAFYNLWADEARKRPAEHEVKLVKYEHLLEDTALEFGRLLSFLGLDSSPEFVGEMVRHTTFDHVRRLEASGRLGYKPSRELLQDERAMVLRRGIAGGYRDFFDQSDHEFSRRAMGELDPWYAYSV